jgi:hypothetical protein
VVEYCNGTSGTCPPDRHASATGRDCQAAQSGFIGWAANNYLTILAVGAGIISFGIAYRCLSAWCSLCLGEGDKPEPRSPQAPVPQREVRLSRDGVPVFVAANGRREGACARVCAWMCREGTDALDAAAVRVVTATENPRAARVFMDDPR